MKRAVSNRTAAQVDGKVPRSARRLPDLAMELVEMMKNPSTNVTKLVSLISDEPALCDRVLRVANSPVLGIPGRISNLSYAITLLGFDALRDTVMKLLMVGSFRSLVNLLVQYEQYWDHSISCAIAARIMARKNGMCDQGDAFIAGLFHDMGILLYSSMEGEGTPRLKAAAEDEGRTTANHSEISAWVAAQWGMADRIVEAIRYHHTPSRATIDPALTATVHVADMLCQTLEIGRYSYDLHTGFDPQALSLLGLTREDLTPERLAEEAAHIRAGLENAPDFETLVKLLKNALVDVIGTLPAEERLTLALHYQEGLPFDDVGRLMARGEDDVRALHDQAMSRLLQTVHDCL